VSQKSLAALIEFYEVLKRKKKVLKVCLDIFYKKARLLLYINNLQIRAILFEKIFEPTNFDISSHEMTKERLKGSKTLINLKEIRVHHDGRNAVIFLATYMGSLVVVKCLKLSKEGLLKKHDDPNPTHFSYELEFLRSLKMKPHPNIIQLIEFDHHLKCLALEYVAHGSLRRYLLNHRSKELLSFEELILIAAKIAGALNFLEEEGIIHLALQARNVLVDNDGDVKLTGFQFCRRQERVKDVRNAILKPHFKWMDPQALLYQSVDPRTVSWSFGVFLYELLTYGCEPYSRIKRHTEVIEQYLDSSEARVYVRQISCYLVLLTHG
jgi:serine/threonine protein kinase